MTKLSPKLFFLCASLLVSTHALTGPLEDDLANAIRTACHGNLIDPDDSDFFKFFNIDSPICKKLKNQGADFDYSEARQQYQGKITQKDLHRIYDTNYLQPATPSKIQQQCTYNLPGKTIGVDSHCTQIREALAARSINMSLQQYERLDNACNRDRDCIREYAKKWQTNQPSYPRKQQVGGLNFGELMTDTDQLTSPSPARMLLDDTSASNRPVDGSETAATNIGFDSVRPNSDSNDPAAGDIGFDNIYANREAIRINGIKQTLFNKNDVIASRCQCAFNQSSCFRSDRFSHGELNKVMAKVDANYENEMQQMCMTWVDLLQGKTSDNEKQLTVYLNNADIIASNLDKLHSGYNDKKATLQEKQTEINYAIRRQEEQRRQQEQQNSGFDWGKMAALSSGILLGGGMEQIGSTDMVNLLGRAALDSMEGVDGTENLSMGVTELTQIHNEHLDSMADIEQQTLQMNAANQTNPTQQLASTSPNYDDLLSGNVVQRNLTSAYDASNSITTQALSAQQQSANNTPSAIGAYLQSTNPWKTCVVLASGGTAHYKVQSLQNWNNPQANYVWNQPVRSGTWSMNGNKVTVDVSGYEVNPTTGARKPKQHNFTVTLRGNKLGDATNVGQGLSACR